MVLAKGALSGGAIVRSTTGTELAYDAAGQRVSATTTVSGVSHQETFAYSEDGYLVKVASSDGGATAVQRGIDVRDAMGRVTSHTEYRDDGTTVAFSRTATYAANGDVTGDVVSVLGTDGATTVSTTAYSYNATTSGGYIWGGVTGSGAYMGVLAGLEISKFRRQDISERPQALQKLSGSMRTSGCRGSRKTITTQPWARGRILSLGAARHLLSDVHSLMARRNWSNLTALTVK